MNFRPLVRFKLRTLLLVSTLVAIGLAWQVRGARQQREAVEAIFDHGGWVGYDFEVAQDDSWLYRNGQSRIPKWLLEAVGVDFFHSVVNVKLPVVVDPGVASPPSPESLRELMSHIASLPRVTTLHLADNFATDEVLGHVAAIPQIENLHISDYGQITPEGLRQVSHLRRVVHWSDYNLPRTAY